MVTCNQPISTLPSLYEKMPDGNFPALTTASEPVSVRVLVVLSDITDITPANQQFTVHAQTDMYWQNSQCGPDTGRADACKTTNGIFKFMMPSRAISTSSNSEYNADSLFGNSMGQGCLASNFQDVTIAFNQQFDMSNYPYEVHTLEFGFEAFFSTRFVQLELMDNASTFGSEGVVPASWKLESKSLKCHNKTVTYEQKMRGGSIDYSGFSCHIKVSHVSEEYLESSLVFWMVTMIGNLLVGMGKLSGTTEIGDSAGLAGRAKISFGVLLTYTFMVPKHPYNVPGSSFAGDTPASTNIFTIGIVTLATAAVYSWAMSILCAIWFRNVQGAPRWYHVHFFWHQARTAPEDADPENKTSDTYTQSAAKIRKTAAFVDAMFWIVLHLFAIILGTKVITTAQANYQRMIDA